jgi:hypothetical protein
MAVIEFNTPIPPRKGDHLFRGDLPDWPNNARLDIGSEGASLAYMKGYQRGAELLVQHVTEHHLDKNVLVYPIVFLYRHHLELALKRIIRRSPRLLNRELTQNEIDHLERHRLNVLWDDLKPMFTEIFEAVGWNKPETADVEGVDDYVRQLSAVDLDSFSFRYPHSKKGERSLPEDLKHVNLRHFVELMSRIASYIDGIDTATSAVEGWRDDMEAEYSGDYSY